MFEPNRRDVVGKTLMDFAKIVFGASIASGLFAAFSPQFRLGALCLFVVLFLTGWWFSPPKKGE